MKIEAGAFLERFGKDDRSKRNDDSQLGEGENETNKEEFGEIRDDLEGSEGLVPCLREI